MDETPVPISCKECCSVMRREAALKLVSVKLAAFGALLPTLALRRLKSDCDCPAFFLLDDIVERCERTKCVVKV